MKEIEEVNISVNVRQLSLTEKLRYLTTFNVSIDDISRIVIEMEKFTKTKAHGKIAIDYVDGEILQIDTTMRQRLRTSNKVN